MKIISLRTLYKLAAVGALVGNVTYIYYGGLNTLDIQTGTLKGQVFLYKDLGDEKGTSKSIILKNLQSDLKELEQYKYTLTSVFFDDAKIDSKPHYPARGHQRLVVGAMFDPSQKALIKEFISKHQEYHAVITRDMDVLSGKFPYKGPFSLKIINFRNIYSKIMAYGRSQQLVNNATDYFVEQYPFANHNKDYVEIMVPFGENKRQLETSTLPIPLKSGPVAQTIGS